MKRMAVIAGMILICVLHVSAAVAQLGNADSATHYVTEHDILYRDPGTPGWDAYMEERCRLDIYYPSDRQDFATVVWFHGGGLRAGNRYIPEELEEQNIAIVAVNHRLHPTVTRPAYIEDAAAAVAWVFNNIQEYGGNPDYIFVSGHSAGGYLASMIGLDKRWLSNHGIDADRVAGIIPFSGQAVTHSTIREELGVPENQPFIDEYAPLVYVRSDAPPYVLITGDRQLELLGRYEENALMLSLMRGAEHTNTTLYEMQGFDHGGMRIPGYQILLKHVGEIVNRKR